MKYYFMILGTVLSSLCLAQNCYESTHSDYDRDSWLSCDKSSSPNEQREESHWIAYDLGYVYPLSTTQLWNYNVQNQTDRGMKRIAIDYSIDGRNWTELGQYTLEEASGLSDYAGVAGPDFGGIRCRYVLITVLESWGADCAGLSEIRLDVDALVAVQPQPLPSDLIIYPNPCTDRLTLQTDKPSTELMIINAAGHECLRTPYQSQVDVSPLAPGAYFIILIDAQGSTVSQKFIKL